MGYVIDRKARLRAQLAKVQAALDALYNSFMELAGTTVESYTFDSGEGIQKTKRRDLTTILDNISRLEATENHLINEIAGMGLVSIRLRRKRNVFSPQ